MSELSRMLLLCLATAAVGACEDPVQADAIAALGPEDDGVPEGPLHRPGQPCLLCHNGGLGSAEPSLAVAGTIYADPESLRPLDQAVVILQDDRGKIQRELTNCAGNFMIRSGDLKVDFPMWVTVQAADKTLDMESPIYREGSCAACHTDPLGPTSAGHVFLLPEPEPLPSEFFCE